MNWIAQSPATANVSPGRPKSVYMGQQNSYTFYIYASRPHKHFKIDFTPKRSSQQHVKYGTRSPEISRQHVQKLTPQFFIYIYIYIGYRFPLSLSTIVHLQKKLFFIPRFFSRNVGWVCWSLMSLCHSNGHIETMPAREINPFTALTRIRSQFLRTQ